MSAEFGEHTPFVLIARIKIKPDCVDEYLTLAEQTDKLVNETEPGMLHHTFDSDPDDFDKFVWSEVYANDQAFIDHLNNPCVGTYLEKHADLALSFEVEIFGTEIVISFIPASVKISSIIKTYSPPLLVER